MISRMKADFPIAYLCRRLRVSTSGFSDWSHHVTAPAQRRHEDLTAQVVITFAESKGAAERAFTIRYQRASRLADPVDLLLRDFTSLSVGTILVGDITYIHTQEGWLYLATVIDLASRSMGAKMQCWDNAAAETFFSKLTSESLNWQTFTTRRKARTEVINYIHHFNNVRLHQTLGYSTPTERLIKLTLAA
ncbi:hypothetical protein E3O62_03030 [Cryobacterium sp. TMT2-15-1]|nr:hypothetical protein E3O62_03030 [Cryobacterium sp. TMT2-15-1]